MILLKPNCPDQQALQDPWKCSSHLSTFCLICFWWSKKIQTAKQKKKKSLELHKPNWIPANDRCQRNTFIWRWTCPSYTSLFVKLTLQCLTVGSAKVTFTQLSFLTLRLLIITTNQRTYLLFKSMDEYKMSLSCQASGKAGVLWLDEFPWLYVP